MKTIFADFQSRGVNEFVLDLRYNGGGYEHSANMLAGLLIPEESKDNVFGIFSNNKGKVTHTRYFNTETKGTAGYLKLNSNRIYILTSDQQFGAFYEYRAHRSIDRRKKCRNAGIFR